MILGSRKSTRPGFGITGVEPYGRNVLPPSVEYHRNWACALFVASSWVARATTALRPKPAVLVVSTTGEPDQMLPLTVVSLGTATPRSVKWTRSVLVTCRQLVWSVAG
jgi:hypothetical protein